MLTTSIPIDKQEIRKIEIMVETQDGYRVAKLFRNKNGDGHILTEYLDTNFIIKKSWKVKLSRNAMLGMVEWILLNS